MAQVRWAGMRPAQRGWAVVSGILIAALAGGLLWFGLRTDWRTLYAGLEPEDARQVGLVLTQAQITFEPTADGTGIRVPAAQLDKARLATAGKGHRKERASVDLRSSTSQTGWGRSSTNR